MPKISIPLLFLTIITSHQASGATSPLQITAQPHNIETVFDWSKQRCFKENIPDSPARAFHSIDGSVYLYATHYKNTPLKGSSLDSLEPDCNTLFSGSLDSNPEHYDARIWLQTFYSTNKGQDIYSLGSSDYHGKWFNNCQHNDNHDCWMSAIVLAHSGDGGKHFRSAPAPHHIIAKSPASFSNTRKGATGFLTTSNIVMIGEHYYALFNTAAHKKQARGNCLARTKDLANPRSWLAWDGKDFSDPLYKNTDPNSDGQTCKTLKTLPYKIRSLLWHPASKQYIAVFEVTESHKANKKIDIHFSYALSKNLKDWSNPETIITLKGNEHCQNTQIAGAYPSIIDSTSSDENFGTVSDTAHLYYTRFNLNPSCQQTFDRDLVRIPIQIRSKQ